jgi:hypothetical protein
MVWLVLGVLVCLLIHAWEREDKRKAQVEQGAKVTLPSGAELEVWILPTGIEGREEYEEYVARRAVRQ